MYTHNSCLTVMYPNYYQITILLVVHLCLSLAYFMMTHPHPIASKLPIKTLVARQLPTNTCTYTHVHIHTRIHIHTYTHILYIIMYALTQFFLSITHKQANGVYHQDSKHYPTYILCVYIYTHVYAYTRKFLLKFYIHNSLAMG